MKKTFLIGIFSSLILTQTVSAISFQGMDANPTSPNDVMPRYFVYEVKPGETITDSVKVKNTSSENIGVRVYAVETEINNQNNEVLKAYAGEKKDLAAWISFNSKPEESFELAPDETKIVDFSVQIPANAEKKEYRGGIMVEKMNTEDKKIQDGAIIKTNGRVGIKTFLTVTDTPKVIGKLSDVKQTPWQAIYLYSSIGIFIIALATIVIFTHRKHHKKNKTI